MKKNLRRWLAAFTVLTVASFFLAAAALIFRIRYGSIEPQTLVCMAVDILGIAIMAVFLNGALHEDETDAQVRLSFMVFLSSMAFALNTDFWIWVVDEINDPRAIPINIVANTVYYLANTAVIHTFAIYLRQILPRWPRWASFFHIAMRVYYAILVLALLINLRTGGLFSIADGVYIRGPWTFVAFAVAGFFATALFALIAMQHIDRTEKASMLFYLLISLAAMVVQSLVDGLSLVPISFIIAAATLYVDGHVRQSHLLQAQRLRSQQQQTALTLSQLQPHFLYNALTSAACLCRKDPQLAETVIMDFAGYLRSNLSALQSDTPIAFSQELAHIRSYLNIEQVRFGESLQVVYRIETEDFPLPSLTIQPLVENAVKHGIRKKEDGGTVTVVTRETDTAWEVIVADTGAGFDPASVDWSGGEHVGLVNVQARLRAYGDRLSLESRIGEGTTVTVTVPKKEDDL